MKTLSPEEISRRLTEWYNYTRILHPRARKKVEELKKKLKRREEKIEKLEAGLREKDEEIAHLKTRIKELEKHYTDKNDTDTKHRFHLFGTQRHETGKTKKKNKKSKKKRPADSYNRPLPSSAEVTHTETLSLTHCPHTGLALSGAQDAYERYVEDIQYAPKTVTTYTITRHWCRPCRTLHTPAVPNALPNMRFGLNTLMFVIVGHYRDRLTDETLRLRLAGEHGLSLSDGEVTALRDTAARYFTTHYDGLLEALREAAVVYSDETGWYIRGTKGWVWHIAAGDGSTVVYRVTDTRGKGVLTETVGECYAGTVVSDFYGVYDTPGSTRQKCWAHLHRDAVLLTEAQPENAERQQLATEISSLYGKLRTFKQKTWSRQRAAQTRRVVTERLFALIAQRWTDRGCCKLIQRIERYYDDLLTCTRYPEVSPDNNFSERNLRQVVKHRTITHGNRSDKGARTYEINRSVIETTRRSGGSLHHQLATLLWCTAYGREVPG